MQDPLLGVFLCVLGVSAVAFGCGHAVPCVLLFSSLDVSNLGASAFGLQSIFSSPSKETFFGSAGFSITFNSTNCFPNSSHRFDPSYPGRAAWSIRLDQRLLRLAAAAKVS